MIIRLVCVTVLAPFGAVADDTDVQTLDEIVVFGRARPQIGSANLAGPGIEGPYETELITMILLFVIAFAGAAWPSIRGITHNPEIRSVVAMQAVYVVPMSFWVAFARNDFEIGAWLGVVTLLAYLAQIALQVKNRWQVLAVIIPIISIISTMTFTRQFW